MLTFKLVTALYKIPSTRAWMVFVRKYARTARFVTWVKLVVGYCPFSGGIVHLHREASIVKGRHTTKSHQKRSRKSH